uniref:Protein SirB1 N-terminal domain-containing protein n=1 Tax=Cucumis melo TaxID=3656 RepID=A0A9I9CKR6_CUCME
MSSLTSASASASLCIPRPTSSSSSSSKFFKFNSFSSHSTPPCFRVVCSGGFPQQPNSSKDFNFLLHDAMDSSGIDSTFAKRTTQEARKGFLSQIHYLSKIERDTSISIDRRVDLAKAALYIAAEDDSLVSHSSVPLPVDAFIHRLSDLSMGYCTHYKSSFNSSPEIFLESIERYMYVMKGFRRTGSKAQSEPRALYLHTVLTHRTGSAALLSLIYSEILKMLRLWSLLDFDVEIYHPHDDYSLPMGYHKLKSKESDQAHIMTTQTLLVEILSNLKESFWPFQQNQSRSLFLRAADVANCSDSSDAFEESGFQLASAKAAQHRLERGVWTSVRYGDMRRALSGNVNSMRIEKREELSKLLGNCQITCERLILLDVDSKELRDYSILLYHCGFYEQSLEYLKLYQETKGSSSLTSKLSSQEEEAVDNLMKRLALIMMEDGWSRPSFSRKFIDKDSEPW